MSWAKQGRPADAEEGLRDNYRLVNRSKSAPDSKLHRVLDAALLLLDASGTVTIPDEVKDLTYRSFDHAVAMTDADLSHVARRNFR